MRPKSTGRDLPPRMLRRKKKLKSGKIWTGYYYNGLGEDGSRREIPLGTDLDEAKRKWAEFECTPVAKDVKLLDHIFDRYEREIIPFKAPSTQRDNLDCLSRLRPVFGGVAIDAVTPQHVAQYRDARTAKVRANREITLLSHVFNLAREWGYMSHDNPARGIRKNPEKPRDFYVDDQVWRAVYECASEELRDALDLAYLTGQRPADVLKMNERDIQDGSLCVQQDKTKKKLRILLKHADGASTQLAEVLERIRRRPRKVKSLSLIATPAGEALNKFTLRSRFDAARLAAVAKAEAIGTEDMTLLAQRIKQFQFRDIRPKAASDMSDLSAASKLLGHTEQEITKKVYRRIGEEVRPTR